MIFFREKRDFDIFRVTKKKKKENLQDQHTQIYQFSEPRQTGVPQRQGIFCSSNGNL